MKECCPFCGMETILTDRRYDLPGFPYPHVCEETLRVPNERDFCGACCALTFGQPCTECQPPKPVRTSRVQPVREATELPL